MVIDGACLGTRLCKNSAAIAVGIPQSGNRLQFASPSATSSARYYGLVWTAVWKEPPDTARTYAAAVERSDRSIVVLVRNKAAIKNTNGIKEV